MQNISQRMHNLLDRSRLRREEKEDPSDDKTNQELEVDRNEDYDED